ncbi:MAG: serine hydrolase [Acidobacteria bacterium]|nr:serine hydrolase [Acidobacteriota bacterium]MCW5967503.1 serine hydrolase [Blastocatellales bacterium]
MRHCHWLRSAFVTAFFYCALAVTCLGQSVDQSSLDRIMTESLKAWDVPGAAIVVVRGDEVVYLKGFGVRAISKPDAVTPDTLFAIGSTSKAFTTAAMAALVDDGKMAWNDPVRKHLPGFRLADPLANESVMMRDLVTHRTGLIRHDLLWYGSPWGRDEIIRRIGFVPLSFPLRTDFQYQNIMYLAAGEAVGHTAGQSWEELVRTRLFEPLGMKTANFSVNEVINVEDRATPHQKVNEKNIQIPWRNIDNVAPAGSINASVAELANWIKLHLNEGRVGGKQIISAANVNEMHMPQMVVRIEGRWKLFFGEPETTQLSYGLGWFISSYRGHKLVGHGGSIDGFRAQIQLAPAAKIGVAVLANLGNTQLPEAVAYQVIDLMLGLEPRDWNKRLSEESKKLEAEGAAAVKARFDRRVPDTRPSLALADYAGEYENPGYGAATVAVDGEALVLRWSFARLKLEHFHYDTFTPGRTGAMAGEMIQFYLNPEGKADSMIFQGMRFRRVNR